MLRARLYEAELKRREEEAQAPRPPSRTSASAIRSRSYVLQPYQLVKDLRTGVESTNPSAVLDGDIDAFIEAALAERIHADAKAAPQRSGWPHSRATLPCRYSRAHAAPLSGGGLL